MRILLPIAGLAVFGTAVLMGCGDDRSVEPDHDGPNDTDSGSDSSTDTGPIECDKGEFVGDFTLESGDDLSPLFGYTSISGDLEILDSSLTDLTGLECLEAIGGKLKIGTSPWIDCVDLTPDNPSTANPELVSLEGLDSLTTVISNVVIVGNAVLQDLDALANLSGTVGHVGVGYNAQLQNLDGLAGIDACAIGIGIVSNPALQDIDGLSNIESVGDSVTIGGWFNSDFCDKAQRSTLVWYGNQALQDLDGLSGLQSIGGSISVTGNPSLKSFAGLGNLSSVGGSVEISHNSPELASLDGLDSLESIGGNLKIGGVSDFYAQWESDDGNAGLESIDALSNLASVGGDVWIANNTELESLAPLEDLDFGGDVAWIVNDHAITDLTGTSWACEADYLHILGNEALNSLEGLDCGETIHASLEVRSNPALETLSGVGGLTHTLGALSICDNDALSDITALSELVEVAEWGLAFQGNASLENLDDLGSLVSVAGGLWISENDDLADLHGLSSLEFLGEDLTVTSNPVLPTCEAEWLRDHLVAQGWEGTETFYGNWDGGTCE